MKQVCKICFGYMLQHRELSSYFKCLTCGNSRKKAKVIKWDDPKCMISLHFTVKEALWLPQWHRLANESDGLTDEIKENLITLCQKLDIMRNFFDKPINIHVMFRPPEYNKLIGGAKNSSHCLGKAVDFDIIGLDCDTVRKMIMDANKLEEWKMRMEDLPGSPWIHLDITPIIAHRFFKP